MSEPERLLLDTTVLIAAERDPTPYIDDLAQPGDDLAIAAVTAAELLAGAWRAEGQSRLYIRRKAFAETILSIVTTVDYTLATAMTHARLLAHTQAEGRPRGAHDLIIAATAITAGRMLVSADAKAGFGDLPGLRYRLLAP